MISKRVHGNSGKRGGPEWQYEKENVRENVEELIIGSVNLQVDPAA